MLFVALLKALPETMEQRIARRLEWGYPEGVQVVAEYWLQTPDPAVVVACEADHIGQLWALFNDWNDVFDISIYPAVAAKEGLELLKQMAQG
jgi:hypothetical protein